MTAPELSGDRKARATQSSRLIVLVGFMGAGKTTVGRLLAVRSGWRFLDVDAEIEAETGSTIAELFTHHGEPWFRALERGMIARLARQSVAAPGDAADARTVLALGGGAIEDAETRELLLRGESLRMVHLEVTLAEAIRRCTADATNLRPVLADRERLAARYKLRLGLYRLAHLSVEVDGLPPEQVAERVRNWLHENES